MGLETIHDKKFIHRDFHSGNILFDPNVKRMLNDDWKIGDLGLSQAVNRAIYTSRPLSALISKCSSIYSISKISFDKRDSNYISKLENNSDVESLSSQNLNSAIQKFPTALDSRYNSTELEFDINTESLSLYDLNSTIQNYSTALNSRYISAELDLDINTESLSSQNLSSTLQNYSTALDFRYNSTELELDIKTERSQNLSSTIQKFSTSLKKRRNEELLNVETHDDSGKRIKTTSFNYS
ncbi:unnamed protein product [Rhizophagus irregularis]|nr:unnamed protein product [Rhizophagus irregularis]